MAEEESTNVVSGLISHILTPGSTLSPTFIFILDFAFAFLFFVFVCMLFLTRSFHVVALMAIEGCLWGSVKWFVSELRKAREEEEAQKSAQGTQDSKKDQ